MSPPTEEERERALNPVSWLLRTVEELQARVAALEAEREWREDYERDQRDRA